MEFSDSVDSRVSLITQLSARGVSPKVFSHCLKGESGGILVLGEILNPSMVYTPLVPAKAHYNVNLQSITVNGKKFPIDPAAFSTSDDRGTIVDSGTTLVYLPTEAYDPFVSAEGDAMWCVIIGKSDEGSTILGDLVLKDKIIVYDLARQRIGWADHDCSSPVNVSVSSGKDEAVCPCICYILELMLFFYLFWS
ncbi:hypothetical protein K7X08_007334 [Anisodus acutangulus]|uniref:Xylanase inhibitor C-terminal domain-containing protein n=1 Tax=Anisodus acutangulus TaxID=402998 RepID=A0A9Q1LG01_9SOLA|nr:hypothetical protein K7X08_007334 [Anisodus acutangulus]